MSDDEEFASGYGPAAPPGDNLSNDFQQESARSFAALSRARGDRVERIVGALTMTDASSPLAFSNRAVLEQPITDAELTVKWLRTFYESGEGPFLLDSAWPTSDLRAHGFTLTGHPPLMVRHEVRGRGYGLAITAATIAVDLTKTAALVASDLVRDLRATGLRRDLPLDLLVRNALSARRPGSQRAGSRPQPLHRRASRPRHPCGPT